MRFLWVRIFIPKIFITFLSKTYTIKFLRLSFYAVGRQRHWYDLGNAFFPFRFLSRLLRVGLNRALNWVSEGMWMKSGKFEESVSTPYQNSQSRLSPFIKSAVLFEYILWCIGLVFFIISFTILKTFLLQKIKCRKTLWVRNPIKMF